MNKEQHSRHTAEYNGFAFRCQVVGKKVVSSMDDSGFFYEPAAVEDWEVERIPAPLVQAWHSAHKGAEMFLRNPNSSTLSRAIRSVWEFDKTVREHCSTTRLDDINEALDRFTHTVETWDDHKIQSSQSKIERVLEQIVANLHLRATKALAVDQEAWYYRLDKAKKPLSRKDVTRGH